MKYNDEKNHLENNLKHLSIDIYKNVTSTNDLAKTSSKVNHLIVAKSQSKGRGKMYKSFYSPENKGLYFSYIIKPDFDLNLLSLVTIVAALAIVSALPIKTDIKWLNDIYYQDKKIAGILVECDIDNLSKTFNKIIVGVGINLFNTNKPKDLESIIGAVEDFYNKPIDQSLILIDFIKAFDQRITEITKNPNKLINDYKSLCTTLDKEIIYNQQTVRAKDINKFGHLIVADCNNNLYPISSGSIYVKN